MKLGTTVDGDKQVDDNLSMSKNIVEKAPKSTLKNKCLGAHYTSKTEEGGQSVNAAVLLLQT